MPLRDKLIVGFTILMFIASPYMAYKMIKTGMKEDMKLIQTILDNCTAPPDRQAAEMKRRRLKPIVVGQVGIFITTQVGMIGLAGLLIREHERRQQTWTP